MLMIPKLSFREIRTNQTNQPKQTKQKLIRLYYLDKVHFVKLLFCSSNCTIWIQQRVQSDKLLFCLICLGWRIF